MKRIVVADLYGTGGLLAGKPLAEKIEELGPEFEVLGPYDPRDWEAAATDLDVRPPTDLIAAIGYGAGANNIVEIGEELGRPIHLLVGVAPIWRGRLVDQLGLILVSPNVRRAVCIYNARTPHATRYCAEGLRTALHPITFRHLHPDPDNSDGVHGLILGALRKLAVTETVRPAVSADPQPELVEHA